MYEIYDTKAYVLKTLVRKESDQRVLLFTENFGLIWATVSGSKKEGSKMKSFLQDLTFCNIFLVHGKGGYRITGGSFIENLFFYFDNEGLEKDIFKKKIHILKSIFTLFEKVFHKGEKDEKIFNLLVDFTNDIKNQRDKKVIEQKEVVFLSHIFFMWGYLDQKDLLQSSSEKEIQKLREKINENISKIAF